MIALATIRFPNRSLGVHHLLELPARVAVLVGGEDAVIGLITVQNILDGLIQSGVPR